MEVMQIAAEQTCQENNGAVRRQRGHADSRNCVRESSGLLGLGVNEGIVGRREISQNLSRMSC